MLIKSRDNGEIYGKLSNVTLEYVCSPNFTVNLENRVMK